MRRCKKRLCDSVQCLLTLSVTSESPVEPCRALASVSRVCLDGVPSDSLFCMGLAVGEEDLRTKRIGKEGVKPAAALEAMDTMGLSQLARVGRKDSSRGIVSYHVLQSVKKSSVSFCPSIAFLFSDFLIGDFGGSLSSSLIFCRPRAIPVGMLSCSAFGPPMSLALVCKAQQERRRLAAQRMLVTPSQFWP